MKHAQDLTILLQDDHLLVVNKPAGLLTVPGRQGGHSLREAIAHALGITQKLFLVHRLDAGTSGVLLLAKTSEAQTRLSQQFQDRQVQKEYLALVRGRPEEDSGLIVAPIAPHPRIPAKMIVSEKKGRPSQTKWQIVERLQGISLVRCRPLTGRQHQIRIHLALIDLPLLVDPLYGSAEAFYLSQIKPDYKPSHRHEERPLLARLSLHAESLTFTHPQTHQPVRVEAALPKDMQATLTQLRKICGSTTG